MKNLLALFLLCALSVIWMQPEGARSDEPERMYLWQEYKKNPATYDVAADSTYVWAAYGEGVIRWHKADRTYQTFAFDAEVTAVVTTPNDNVWIGTSNGLHRYDGLNWTQYTTSNGLPKNYVTALGVGPQGQILVGTLDQIVIFDGGQWIPAATDWTVDPYQCFTLGNISAIALDPQNRLWVGIQNAPICYFDAPYWRTFSQNQISVSAKEIKFHPNGDMWLAGVHDGNQLQAAGRLTSGGVWTTYNQADGLPGNFSTSVTFDHAGHVWLGFDYSNYPPGIARFDGSSWFLHHWFNGFDGGHVSTVGTEPAGNIWTAGTNVSGRVNNAWTTYLAGIPTAIGYDMITTLHVAPDDRIWVGTHRSGAVAFDGQVWQHFTKAQGLGGEIVDAITTDHDGTLWFGTSREEFDVVGAGLTRFDGQTAQTFTMADGLADNRIAALAVDEANDIWIAHPFSGVSHKSGSGWATYSTEDGLLSNRTKTIIAHDGDIWVGYGTQGSTPVSGISRFDGSAWTSYGAADGLPGNVRDLTIDRNNVLVALTGHGVFQWDGVSWSDLVEGGWNEFAFDKENHLWLVNDTSAARFDGSQIHPVDLTGTGISGLNYYVTANSTGDALWFRSNDGIARLGIFEVSHRTFLPAITR